MVAWTSDLTICDQVTQAIYGIYYIMLDQPDHIGLGHYHNP